MSEEQVAGNGGSLTRREWLKLGAVSAAAAGCATGRSSVAKSDRPNILFLMADQFRGDCLGVDGNPFIDTPNLDWLARDGVRFSSAYSCTPTCTPARAALLTGLQPWNHGMLGYSRVAEQYPFEMIQALRDGGYYTAGIGKMHWHPQRNAHGFHQVLLDESGRAQDSEFRSDYRAWFASKAPNLDPDKTGVGWNSYRTAPYALPEELHPTFWTAQTAQRFLESYDGQDPFFLKVSFARPHSPYDPPKRFWKRYKDAAVPPAVVGDWADNDITCGWECMFDEYMWHVWSSWIGYSEILTRGRGEPKEAGKPKGWCEDLSGEWHVCTKEDLKNVDPLAYDLFNNRGYKLPKTIPYGEYGGNDVEYYGYEVEVRGDSSDGKYFINRNRHPNYTVKRGNTYYFDQSLESNFEHKLRFSTTKDGTHNGGVEYLKGVATRGHAGKRGAYTKITVGEDAPDKLYYFCSERRGIAGSAVINVVD